MVKERPILFSGPMVRAIIDGRKTQTRRVIKPQPECIDHDVWKLKDGSILTTQETAEYLFHEVYGTHGTPYGSLWPNGGDRLWVRETFRPIETGMNAGSWDYRADDPGASGKGFMPWKPSIFMPRAASRITLEITDVRVERLNEISEADAKAEGIEPFGDRDWWYSGELRKLGQRTTNPVWAFQSLWESINGKDSWAVNPWVWAITFKKV